MPGLNRYSPTIPVRACAHANSTAPPGRATAIAPIAYQQEFFNQLTSEEVRTRFVRRNPVLYWFKPSGRRNEALDRRVYACASDSAPNGANRCVLLRTLSNQNNKDQLFCWEALDIHSGGHSTECIEPV
jgi:phage terminase large subunit GpA-like protein